MRPGVRLAGNEVNSLGERRMRKAAVGLLAPRSPKTNSSQSDITSQLMAESIKL